MAIKRAGRLRHRIVIEKREEGVYDELGHESNEWRRAGSVFAEVRDLSGRELERARQTVPDVNVSIVIRHCRILKVTDRIVFRGRIFHIGAITDPENRKEEMILLCTEQLGATKGGG